MIFDWDGTLCDSTATITRAMQLAADELRWEVLGDSQIHEIIGLGLPEALKTLYPAASSEGLLELREVYARHFIALDELNPAQLFPGVRDTLVKLKDSGHQLAVATGKARKGLDRILRGVGMSDFFDASRCADETASKPHPLMLNELLAHFDVNAQQAVMLGDTEFDMAMARAIDMPRIAVSYGAHHIDRLRGYEPQMCLDRFDQLLGWEPLKGV